MTADEQAGIDWWNALNEADRRWWLWVSQTAVPAVAWAWFKCVRSYGGGSDAKSTG